MFVDLDDFKKINDRFGHEVGDILLQSISHKFSNLLEHDDIVSRFGGDEFVFCFPSLNSKSEAENKLRDVQSVFNQNFDINGKSITTSCSVGITMYPDDADNSLDLISKADIVLYKSKEKHKGGALFFDQSIDEQVNYEFSLEEELRAALDNNEITVVYQPQIDIKTGLLCGVEALSRWHNKKLGSISPVDFIAVAEEIGVIHAIGDFVLQKACEDSLDDFGTGYSSLSYLNILPITEIKIDRSFINGLFINEQSETLVKAIIAIGASCQMTVVAEGVEDKAQLDKLIEYQCDLVQGYYFDKPLPIKTLCSKYLKSSPVTKGLHSIN